MQKVPSVDFDAVIERVKFIVTQPKLFYQQLERHGGYQDPLIFAAIMGAVSGLTGAVLSLFSSVHFGGVSFSLLSIFIIPMMTVVGCFIVGALMFAVWKLMGSREDFETSFRCVAYSTAIMPFSIILAVVPYIGTLIADMWWFGLMYFASITRHSLSERISLIVLGIIAILFVAMNLSGEKTQREYGARQGEFNQLMNEIQQQTVEQPDN